MQWDDCIALLKSRFDNVDEEMVRRTHSIYNDERYPPNLKDWAFEQQCAYWERKEQQKND